MTPRDAVTALQRLDRSTPGAFRLAMELLVHFAGLPDVEPERAPLMKLHKGPGGAHKGPRPPWSPQRRERYMATIAAKRVAQGARSCDGADHD